MQWRIEDLSFDGPIPLLKVLWSLNKGKVLPGDRNIDLSGSIADCISSKLKCLHLLLVIYSTLSKMVRDFPVPAKLSLAGKN
jgi:hypothetical protein